MGPFYHARGNMGTTLVLRGCMSLIQGVYKPVGFRVPSGGPQALHLKPETGLCLAGNEGMDLYSLPYPTIVVSVFLSFVPS